MRVALLISHNFFSWTLIFVLDSQNFPEEVSFSVQNLSKLILRRSDACFELIADMFLRGSFLLAVKCRMPTFAFFFSSIDTDRRNRCDGFNIDLVVKWRHIHHLRVTPYQLVCHPYCLNSNKVPKLANSGHIPNRVVWRVWCDHERSSET